MKLSAENIEKSLTTKLLVDLDPSLFNQQGQRASFREANQSLASQPNSPLFCVWKSIAIDFAIFGRVQGCC